MGVRTTRTSGVRRILRRRWGSPCLGAVFWSWPYLERLQFRLPAPDYKICLTKVYVKHAVLKTKVKLFHFLKVYLPIFLLICVKIAIQYLTKDVGNNCPNLLKTINLQKC